MVENSMRYMSVMPYDYVDKLSNEYSTKFDIQIFNSKNKMLKHLQKNICCEETKKPFNFKTLKEYEALGFMFRKENNV
jgi:hypothetical protein